MVTKEQVLETLKTVKDPEIGLDVVSLGLIYEVAVADDKVKVIMTLTSPMCPLGEVLVEEVQKALGGLAGVAGVEVQLTFEPPWDPSRMSEEAKTELGVL